MSGGGNDFAVVDARYKSLTLAPLARALCTRLDSDGFMALDVGENADIRLHFYNSDGSRAALCGNGARCICRFAYELGLVGPAMTLQTDAGILRGWRLEEDRYRVQLPKPGAPVEKAGCTCVTVGVPHALVSLPELCFHRREALRERARYLRRLLDANVNFYTRLGPDICRLLTYERGVEDFTLACGTGCGALTAALGASHLWLQTPGGLLETEYAPPALFLTGPVQVVKILEIPQGCLP